MKKIAYLMGIFILCLGVPFVFAKNYVIGSIQIVDHPDLNNTFKGFKAALEEEGFVEGENVTFIVNKNPTGKIDGVKSAVKEYIDKKVDMILAITTPCALTAVKATSTIPVVFAIVREPVKLGVVKDLEHPGGNATGTMLIYPIFNLIKVAKDIVPGIKKMVLIEDKNKALKAEMQTSLANKAKSMGITLDVVYISSKDEVADTVNSLKGKADCILANNNMEVIHAMDSLIKATLENKIPLITTNEPSVEKGALATSAVDYFKEGKKVGKMAAKILRGVLPSEIPVEKPTSYRLVINLKTANEIGVKVPGRFQIIADRLIK